MSSPDSFSMNPYPLRESNHLTVPTGIQTPRAMTSHNPGRIFRAPEPKHVGPPQTSGEHTERWSGRMACCLAEEINSLFRPKDAGFQPPHTRRELRRPWHLLLVLLKKNPPERASL